MDTNGIAERLEKVATVKKVRRMPRGMLDTLVPQIKKARDNGMTLKEIKLHFEVKEGFVTSIVSISAALKRNEEKAT